jgi:hypothetical protein
MSLLEKRPAKRIASAEELVKQIDGLEAPEGRRMRSSSEDPRHPPSHGSAWTMPFAVVAAILAIAAGAVFAYLRDCG